MDAIGVMITVISALYRWQYKVLIDIDHGIRVIGCYRSVIQDILLSGADAEEAGGEEDKLLPSIREIERYRSVIQDILLSGADAEEAAGEEDKLLPVKAAVMELYYDIEDKVDDWILLSFHHTYYKDGIKKHVINFSILVACEQIHYQTVKDIKDITRRFKEIIDGHEKRKIEGCSSPRSNKVDPRLGMIHKDASDLVGVDGPVHDIVKWLSKEEGESARKKKLVSILGCAGSGKTALAKQIYDKFGVNYEYRAFISVSKSSDMSMTEILSCILSQLQNCDYSCTGIEDLPLTTREFLQDKRFFILIDDICDINTWKLLESALFKNSGRGVIMTTTRMNEIAKECCPSNGDLVYRIQPLSVADSKVLFFKRIFGCEEKCPCYLKEASDDLLQKCEGLPLAINAVSGKNSDIDALNYILFLSYSELPLHLRHCLLYFTMFPEDCEIERLRLVHRWISEGFIRSSFGEDPVELGEKYLYELVNRSLIESVGIQYDGKAQFYRVHKVILDFLISRSTEENFCSSVFNPDSRVHRLYLLGNEDRARVAQLDLSHARSVGFFGNVEQLFPLVKSNAMRVLDLQDCSELGNHHVKDIARNYKLRYLNISGTDISELPIQIGDLKYLETLDASFTELVELPGSITWLEKLVRLFISDETKLPDEIGNMNLQELGNINTFKQSLKFLKELGKLKKLSKLGIIWDTNGISKFDKESYKEKKLASSLCKLDACNLHILSITLYLRDKDGFIGHPFLPALGSIREIYLRHGRICWINKWLRSLSNLEKLHVSSREEIEQQDLQIVGRIPTLVEFRLYSGCLGPIIVGEGFQQLERLELKFSFSQLMFEVGAMPNLKKLDLHIYLSKFKSAGVGFDFGIQHLSSLVWLSIIMFCEGVDAAYVEAAEGAFKSVASAHSNLPTLKMARESTDFMLQD